MTTKRAYTIEEVKEMLPAVKVRVGKRVVKGLVKGRKNKFATVFTPLGSFEYSWLAVTRAYNSDKTLIA